METHAQHLHTAPGRGWRHYFFEFFMLFLALFCGFLAENLREDISNRKIERRNMETMVANLKSDTASLNEVISINLFRQKVLDTLSRFRYQKFTDTIILKKFIPCFTRSSILIILKQAVLLLIK